MYRQIWLWLKKCVRILPRWAILDWPIHSTVPGSVWITAVLVQPYQKNEYGLTMAWSILDIQQTSTNMKNSGFMWIRKGTGTHLSCAINWARFDLNWASPLRRSAEHWHRHRLGAWLCHDLATFRQWWTAAKLISCRKSSGKCQRKAWNALKCLKSEEFERWNWEVPCLKVSSWPLLPSLLP